MTASNAISSPIGGPQASVCVLVVDDSDSFRRALGRALRARGFRVLEAYSVASALWALEGGRVDLVVTDLAMEHGTGLDLIRDASTSYPRTPCILLSGSVSSEDAAAALRLGAVRVLTKDGDARTLFRAVEDALSRGYS